MCKVTLSYDKNDKVAGAKLADLLSTGLFVQVDTLEEIDDSDPLLFVDDPSIPDVDRDVTPEELRSLLINDLNTIYGVKNAV